MTVHDRKNKKLDPADQMCSDEFDSFDFVLVLLIFVTSVAALVRKVYGPASSPLSHVCAYFVAVDATHRIP